MQALKLLVVCLWISQIAGGSQNCSKFQTKPSLIDRSNKYHLWPDLISAHDVEHGETLLGFNEAIDIIWNNQNPPDCSKAKYLIAEPFFQGVGSEMHVHGVALAVAIATKRVLLQYGGWQWRYKNPHCAAQNKQSLECYYVPISKCTIIDAAATMQTTNPLFKQPLPLHLRTGNSTAATRRLAIRPREPSKAKSTAAAAQGGHSKPHGGGNGASGTAHYKHHGGGSTSINTKEAVAWSAKEDADLEAALIKFGVQGHWQQIAEALGKSGKSDTDSLFRFRNVVRKRLNTRAGPRPQGKANFNDEDSLTDLLVDGYGVVLINKAIEVAHDAASNSMALRLHHADKVSDNVVMLSHKVMLAQRKYVAREFAPILECVEAARRGYSFWWWRAVSASYFLRPNAATLDLMQQHADPVLRDANGMCVSAYVRHGDKGLEMSLMPFKKYADTAYCMWQTAKDNLQKRDAGPNCAGVLISADGNTAVPPKDPRQTYSRPPAERPKGPRLELHAPPNAGQETMPASFAHIKQPLLGGFNPSAHSKVLYLGSEDPHVFSEAKAWAAQHQVDLRFSNVSQLLLSDRAGVMKHRDMENSMPANRQMEYFSYLLHLGDLLRCRAFVCTLASNYCRLVDELRATVGGKANAYLADLSLESCANPPCVRPFSLAGNEGEVHDPTYDTLWRM